MTEPITAEQEAAPVPEVQPATPPPRNGSMAPKGAVPDDLTQYKHRENDLPKISGVARHKFKAIRDKHLRRIDHFWFLGRGNMVYYNDRGVDLLFRYAGLGHAPMVERLPDKPQAICPIPVPTPEPLPVPPVNNGQVFQSVSALPQVAAPEPNPTEKEIARAYQVAIQPKQAMVLKNDHHNPKVITCRYEGEKIVVKVKPEWRKFLRPNSECWIRGDGKMMSWEALKPK